MGKFINPITDFGFHRIFGQEVHKELLIDFLNQLFFGEHDIEDITFLNPIQTPETLDDRGIVFDVHCKDSNGNLFVVEMQTGAQPYFHDRGLYYLARAISNQGQRGKDWKFALQLLLDPRKSGGYWFHRGSPALPDSFGWSVRYHWK